MSNEKKETTSRFQTHYRDHQRIGEGSFGRVYRCVERASEETYAIKELARTRNPTQEREVQALIATCGHPYIVRFIRDWQEDSSLYICFEYSASGDLGKKIAHGFRFDECSLMMVFSHVAAGLKHIHSKRYVHCDIKPANIMEFVGKDGQPVYKIGDFGIAMRCGASGVIESSSGDGDGKYIAPEVLHNRIVSCKADVYSLGMSIVELGRGEKFPSNREDWVQLRMAILSSDLGFLCSIALKKLIMNTLDELDSRPSSAELSKRIQHMITPARGKKMIRVSTAPSIMPKFDENQQNAASTNVKNAAPKAAPLLPLTSEEDS